MSKKVPAAGHSQEPSHTEADTIAKMTDCKEAAVRHKIALVDQKDFEAAARWRDVELALERAIGYVAPKPQFSGIKVVVEGVDGEWIETPRSSTG